MLGFGIEEVDTRDFCLLAGESAPVSGGISSILHADENGQY
jgi:hypothetical protein